MGFFSKIFNFFRPIVKNIQTRSALDSVFMEPAIEKAESIPSRPESKLLTTYLDSPLGSPSDVMVKKAMATAVAIAKKRGVTTIVPTKNPMELAAAVDEGMTRMKVAYKVGKGLLDSTKAADEIIDRAAARVTAFTDKVIEIGTPIVIDKVMTAAAHVFPPVAVVAPIVKVAAPFIAKAAKTVVRAGVKVVATAAKSVVKTVVAGAKKVGKWFKKLIFG